MTDGQICIRLSMDNIQFTNPQSGGNAAYYGSAAPRKKSRGPLLIIVVLIILVILGGIGVYFVLNDNGDGYSYGGSEPYIGILHVEGTMSGDNSPSDTYQHDWLLKNIDYMIKDDQNKGILVYVDSPGGSIYQADELYLRLEKYQKKTGRPLYAYFGEIAASGGYYIASGADKIYANRNSTTGSIGVYAGPYIDVSRLLDELGVDVELITAGDNKGMGNGYEPLTEEQRAILQSSVDEAYYQFVSIVAEGRGMTYGDAQKLADGRTYTAYQAYQNGLIDGICEFETAKGYMLAETELDCGFVTVKYAPKSSVTDIFNLVQDALQEKMVSGRVSEAEAALKLIEKYNSQLPKYLAQ